MNNMRKSVILFFTLIFILQGGNWAVAAEAPLLPAACWGTVNYNDGSPIMTGSVEAVINGAVCGRTGINNGFYASSGAGPKLLIRGSSSSSGQTVQFRVIINSQETFAQETMLWETGSIARLDLSLSINPTSSSQSSEDVTASPATGLTSNDIGSEQSSTGGTGSTTSNTAGTNNNTSTSGDTTTETASNTTANQSSSTSSNGGGTSAAVSSAADTIASNTGSAASRNSQAANTPGSTVAAGTNQSTTESAASLQQFNDLPIDHWAHQVLQLMVNRQVISGVAADRIAPDSQVSRAQFVTMLVRAMGLGLKEGANSYQDVQTGSWYYPYVQTASAAGLIQGYGNQRFAPEANISREQMAVILVKALHNTTQKPALPDSETAQLLNTYSDTGDLSPWARSDLAWAVKNGLINGYPNGKLAPRQTATRAEAAMMLHKFMQSAGLSQ